MLSLRSLPHRQIREPKQQAISGGGQGKASKLTCVRREGTIPNPRRVSPPAKEPNGGAPAPTAEGTNPRAAKFEGPRID
jgi:hypothetical protein